MLLYYIRHAHPVYNPDQLTPLGKRQAEAIGKRLAMHGVDRIFSSTSNRAIETAVPLSEMIDKKIELLDFANECHAEKYFKAKRANGRLDWICDIPEIRYLFMKPEIKTDPSWYDHPSFTGYNFKEGIKFVEREADAFLESLGYKHIRSEGYYELVNPTDERIALFAHAGFGQAFLSAVLDIPYPQISNQFHMGHTGMTVIQFGNSFEKCVPNLFMYASDGHIYKEGLPTNYRGYSHRI